MNERIKELIEQCTHQVYDSRTRLTDKFDKEKFAELLVRECIDILDKEVYLATREDGEQAYIDIVLLEHFGVKV